MGEEKEIFSKSSDYEVETIPVGPIGLIPMRGTEAMAQVIDSFLVGWRNERLNDEKT